MLRDASGRQVLLRGINLGGDSKVPWPDGGTDRFDDFSGHRTVSFVGRPFPLAEAHEHFARLAHWGFNCLRLLTTWEAVEHAGPGQYDREYLDYFEEICRLAGRFGFHVFVDFHQDVWSRMSGGDGAPGWTFDAVGLDFTKFDAAGAAHVMQNRYDYSDPQRRQAAYPQMSWGGNHRLPANGVMWTLFWGGRLLTPDFCIDGRNVQDYLQESYLGSVAQVAARLAGMSHVVGFDTLNEPALGWMSMPLTYRHLAADEVNPLAPRIGPALSPLDCLAILQGGTVEVPRLVRDHATGQAVVDGTQVLNTAAQRVWLPSRECPFEAAGAYHWDETAATAGNDDFFRIANGRALDVYQDGMQPFFHRVADTIRAYNPDWLLFAEIDPFGGMAGRKLPQPMPERSVNAGHWYDVRTLFLKTFASGTAEEQAARRQQYLKGLGVVRDLDMGSPDGMPTLIGEFGIPFDLDDGAAYDAWGAGDRSEGPWASHVAALTQMYEALDELQLNATLWNYSAANRNDLLIGDCWNQEDLSVYSRDQWELDAGPGGGGRAVKGFSRPYPARIAGTLVAFSFDAKACKFTIDFHASGSGETIIHVPRTHFPDGIAVEAEGSWTHDGQSQVLCHAAPSAGPARIVIQPA